MARVLVVEDSKAQAQFICLVLKKAGFEIEHVERLAEARKLLGEQTFDAVLLDLMLPDCAGFATFLSTRDAAKTTPIVVLTGADDNELALRAVQEGAQDYLLKSEINQQSLARSLHYALERHARLEVERALRIKEDEVRVAKMKEAFVQVASHELQTPLTVLLGLSALASTSPGLSQPLAGWLERIRKAGIRLQDLIDQIVKLLLQGRIEQRLTRTPVDLAVLLREAVRDVTPFIEQRRQTIDVDFDSLGEVVIEPFQIRDCVGHLLFNAIKFTPDGGKIRLHASKELDQFQIAVSDTGIGIPPDSLKRVFEPFYTGSDPMNHSSGTFEFGRHGLGLGLSIVKLFVEMHNGSVTIESEVGKGTTVTLVIPATVV